MEKRSLIVCLTIFVTIISQGSTQSEFEPPKFSSGLNPTSKMGLQTPTDWDKMTSRDKFKFMLSRSFGDRADLELAGSASKENRKYSQVRPGLFEEPLKRIQRKREDIERNVQGFFNNIPKLIPQPNSQMNSGLFNFRPMQSGSPLTLVSDTFKRTFMPREYAKEQGAKEVVGALGKGFNFPPQ